MKLLTATRQTQGQRASDFSWCVEGELVTRPAVICDRDRAEGPDGGCGCGRSFTGLSSSKATTTAMVRDLDGYTLDDLILAIADRRGEEGWDAAPDVARQEACSAAELAAGYDTGTVLEIRLGEVFPRLASDST